MERKEKKIGIKSEALLSIISNLSFLDEPEIQVEKAWVHADVGIEAEISCIVHAVPAAEVRTANVIISDIPSFLTVLFFVICISMCVYF